LMSRVIPTSRSPATRARSITTGCRHWRSVVPCYRWEQTKEEGGPFVTSVFAKPDARSRGSAMRWRECIDRGLIRPDTGAKERMPGALASAARFLRAAEKNVANEDYGMAHLTA